MPGERWSREDIAYLFSNPRLDPAEVQTAGHALGRTHHAIRMKQSDLAKKRLSRRDEDVLNGSMQLLDREETPKEREDYYQRIESASQLRSQARHVTDETEWFAPDDGLPIATLFDGDWHCGAHGVMYDKLDQTLALVRSTPGLYYIGMGDYHEGVSIHSKAAPALYSGCYNSADEQEERVMMRLRAIGPDRTIVLAKGNHDAWIERHAGLSRLERQGRELGVPTFGEGGGTVYVNVGEQRYAVGVRHNQYRGNSQLNTTNAQRVMVDSWWSWDQLHVAAVAHFHFNDMHIASRRGKRCIYFRSGSYKTHDSYAKAHGFVPELGSPLAIYLPDEERVLGFRGDDLDMGLAQFALLRERYAQRLAA